MTWRMCCVQVTSSDRSCSYRMPWALHLLQCSAPPKRSASGSRGPSEMHGADAMSGGGAGMCVREGMQCQRRASVASPIVEL